MFTNRKFVRVVRWVSCLAGLALAGPALAQAPSLGLAGDFALLTVPGNSCLNLSLATVNGDTGAGTQGKIYTTVFSRIIGDVLLAPGAARAGFGRVTGTVLANQANVATAINDALAASAEAAALPATVTLSGLVGNQTITGNGGLNVIDINGNVSLINAGLTLAGTTGDIFVINISGSMTTWGRGGIMVAGDVTPEHVLVNFTGQKAIIYTHTGSQVEGTILGPNLSGMLGGSFGSILAGGGGVITLASGAMVSATPFAPPPPPSCGGQIQGVVGGLCAGQAATVHLFDCADHGEIRVTTTDSQGCYEFTDLRAGGYIVHLDVPASCELAPGTTNDDVIHLASGAVVTDNFPLSCSCD